MGHARDTGTGIPRLLMRPSRALRVRLVLVVLLAFVLRAVIPIGFMPAADGSLSLAICPGGLPAGLLPGRSTGQGTDPSTDPGRDPGTDQSMGNGTAHSMSMFGSMQTPAHQHRGHGSMEGYCAFTTGFSSAPPPPLLAALLLLLVYVALIAVSVPAPAGIRLVHVPQARAPPRAV